MSCPCEFIGEITDPTLTIDRVMGGDKPGDVPERFYSVRVKLRACTLPVLISEYNLGDLGGLMTGKVRVTGSLFSDYISGQLPNFYIYANKVEAVDPDVELTNEVRFSGTVTKVKPASVDSFGRDVVSMYLSTVSPMSTESVLFLILKNKLARVNKDRAPKFKVRGTGYIKPFRDVFEILVKEFEII